MGPLTYFLALEISLTWNGLCIDQRKYVEDLISLVHLTCIKISVAHLELNAKIHKDAGIPLPDPTLYSCFVGSLIYLTVTRPNISYAVQSRFLSNPHKLHLIVVHCSLCYICGTLDCGVWTLLFFSFSITSLIPMQSGLVCSLAHHSFLRNAKKQTTVSKSFAEV